ncbi:UTRA domain-containing protein [Allofournierella sp.]|uniref:UTRA domain-containing protein n=1 Tax=Allofournierella sp. TaxID=1940256 RepID=UPI000B37007A|nr:UTRA domain-containing protein [uncultured Fournierella sp.]OUN12629.1 GntR family transcriptional regulator [Gemmiger sp. An87]
MPRQKFLQIYSQLKQRIESGEYPVGQLLPSENTLIGEFDCSRNTVRRAISELVRDGYVQTRQGWGVCNIFQPIEHSSYTMGMIESFRETARRTGQTSTTRVVTFEPCTADEAIAAQTGFPVGEELFALQRIHDLDGVARILNISYLRRSCMPGLTREIAEGSLYRYLEEELGMSIITSKRTFTVELATPQDRQWLDLGEYNCLAVVANQVYNSEGVMFEYTQSRHYPGSFRFQDNAVRRPAES